MAANSPSSHRIPQHKPRLTWRFVYWQPKGLMFYLAQRSHPSGTAKCNADVAQLVAHHLAKVRVASSSLVIRSKSPSGTFPARLAQRESASLTRKRSLVQSQYRARGCSAVGSASPCQGEGREFESRHPLHGGLVEWLGNGLQNRVHGFDSRIHLQAVTSQARLAQR